MNQGDLYPVKLDIQPVSSYLVSSLLDNTQNTLSISYTIERVLIIQPYKQRLPLPSKTKYTACTQLSSIFPCCNTQNTLSIPILELALIIQPYKQRLPLPSKTKYTACIWLSSIFPPSNTQNTLSIPILELVLIIQPYKQRLPLPSKTKYTVKM